MQTFWRRTYNFASLNCSQIADSLYGWFEVALTISAKITQNRTKNPPHRLFIVSLVYLYSWRYFVRCLCVALLTKERNFTVLFACRQSLARDQTPNRAQEKLVGAVHKFARDPIHKFCGRSAKISGELRGGRIRVWTFLFSIIFAVLMLLFVALFLKLWRFTNTACLSQIPNRQKRRDVKWVRISSKAQFVALLLHEHKDRFLFNRFFPLFIWICVTVRIYCRFESQRLWDSNRFEEAEFTRKAIFARAHVFLLMVRHSQYLHENIAERQRRIARSIFNVLFETSLIGCCTTVMIWVFSTVSPANELYEFIRICTYNQSTTSTTSTRTLSGPKVVKRDTRVRVKFALRVETLIFHDFSSMIRPLQWFANLDWNETSNEISWNFTET